MASIDFKQREISIKLVYWGPALSGKTTNVSALHGFMPERLVSSLSTLDSADDRTIFFDYMTGRGGPLKSYQTRLNIFSVPGQARYRLTRKVVLQGADGVVFVADSQTQEAERNQDALRDLHEVLRGYGIDPATFPQVFLYNKRDLPGVMPVDTLDRDLNPRGLPCFEGVATEGRGVLEAFNTLVEGVYAHVEQRVLREATTLSFQGSQGGSSAPVRTLEELVERIRGYGEHSDEQVQRATAQLRAAPDAASPLPVVEALPLLKLDAPATPGGDGPRQAPAPLPELRLSGALTRIQRSQGKLGLTFTGRHEGHAMSLSLELSEPQLHELARALPVAQPEATDPDSGEPRLWKVGVTAVAVAAALGVVWLLLRS